MLLAFFGGRRCGAIRRRDSDRDLDVPNDAVIGGTLGLLALLMAFTFGMSASRFDTRRQLLLDEVNAIGAAYLWAGMVPEPERNEVRRLLREYVQIRAEAATQPQLLPQAISRSEDLHDEMQSQAERLGRQNSSSEVVAMFIESLTRVIDFHNDRVVVNDYRISMTVWIALYLVSILTMTAVGYRLGHAGTRDVAISVLFALAISIVIYLIADLDRGYEGNIQINQEPLLKLNHKLSASSH